LTQSQRSYDRLTCKHGPLDKSFDRSLGGSLINPAQQRIREMRPQRFKTAQQRIREMGSQRLKTAQQRIREMQYVRSTRSLTMQAFEVSEFQTETKRLQAQKKEPMM